MNTLKVPNWRCNTLPLQPVVFSNISHWLEMCKLLRQMPESPLSLMLSHYYQSRQILIKTLDLRKRFSTNQHLRECFRWKLISHNLQNRQKAQILLRSLKSYTITLVYGVGVHCQPVQTGKRKTPMTEVHFGCRDVTRTGYDGQHRKLIFFKTFFSLH